MLHLRDLGAKRASVAAGFAHLCDLCETEAKLRAKRAIAVATRVANLSNTEAKLRAERAAVAA